MKAALAGLGLMLLAVHAPAAPILYNEEKAAVFFEGYGTASQQSGLFATYKKSRKDRKLPAEPPYNLQDMKSFLLTLRNREASPIFYDEEKAAAFFEGYGMATQQSRLFAAYKKSLIDRELPAGPPYTLQDMKDFADPPTPKEYYSYGDPPKPDRKLKTASYGAMSWQKANDVLMAKSQVIAAEEKAKMIAPPPNQPPNLMAVLEGRKNKQEWYHPSEVMTVWKYGYGPVPYLPEKLNPYEEGVFPKVNFASLVGNFRIRASWNDILVAESQDDPGNPGKRSEDLVGAVFSYAYNAEAPSSMWTVKGALLYPMGWRGVTDEAYLPDVYAFVPSLSIDKVGGQNVPASKQIDQMVFRGAAYIEWDQITPIIENVQLRATPVFVTTTEMNAALPGYEVEVEPQLTLDAGDNLSLHVGYPQVLIPKATVLEDGSDYYLLRMNLRFWLHLEGGDVTENGEAWGVTDGGFMRVGPMGQVRLESPGFAYFKSASLTATIAYLPTIYGNYDNDWYINLSGALSLYEDKATGRRFSLVGQYTNGSLLLTGETVNLFTLGVGVVY